MLGDIPVTMERRKVKNLNLYVQPPEGCVLATIPWRMREADAIKLIRSKENWIRTAREKVRSRQKSANAGRSRPSRHKGRGRKTAKRNPSSGRVLGAAHGRSLYRLAASRDEDPLGKLYGADRQNPAEFKTGPEGRKPAWEYVLVIGSAIFYDPTTMPGFMA